MGAEALGRTNRSFPRTWLRLIAGHPPLALSGNEVVKAALERQTVIDFSAAPAFWGSFVRGSEDAILMARGGLDIANAPDEKGAFDLIQAHLIESLSAIGRERLDFYFLQVRAPLEEFQISGALEALEGARQEKHVQYLGLASAGAPMTTQSVWQFHDAFEVLLLQQPDSALEAMAKDRRVGIVTTYPSDYTYLQDFSGTVAEGAHA